MKDNSAVEHRPEECESCSSDVAELKAYRNTRYFGSRQVAPETHTHKWLCSLCATTMAGSGTEYPEQYREGKDLEILQAVCYVGNAVMAEIQKLREEIHGNQGK